MNGDAVVTADWLAERLDDPGVSVLDVREAWEYDGIGHVPGARNVPFDTFRSEAGDEGMLPGTETWADLLSAAGVANDDHLVAYDDTHGVFAARFLVTALLYGHPPEKLHLLNGDYSAWTREHGVESGTPEVGNTDYGPREPEHSPLVGAEDVAAASGDPDAVVVDTRSPEEYAAGHIPNAVNLDWIDLVDDETRGLRPEAELRETLEERGITPEKRVVLYCNTARRISHTYVVLTWLGYEAVAFYEGSMTDWEAAERPTESA
jgi:thiosulfate/3-mercaptopyruvate sulfurtransferase